MTNTELAILIRDVANKLEESQPFVCVGLVHPLRPYAQPGCHEGLGDMMNGSEAGFRLQLEWFAGQLLIIVDNNKWFALNSWLNCVKKFTTPRET